jgi:hypothetical protein
MADFDFDNATSPLKTSGYPQDLTGLRAYLNAQAGVGDGGNNPTSPTAAPSVSPTSRVVPPQGGTAPTPPPTPTAPAAVSPSGQPTAYYFQQGMEGQLSNARAAEKIVASMPPTDTASAALQEKYSKLATPEPLYDDKGKMLPQDRPSVGQRIWRGARGALEGLAFGGIPGAMRGAVAPQIYPGDSAYGAPNSDYQHREASRRQQEGAVGGQLAASRAAFKESNDRLIALSKERRDASTSFNDVTKGATGEEAAQNKGELQTALAEKAQAQAENVGPKAPASAIAGHYARYAADHPDNPLPPDKLITQWQRESAQATHITMPKNATEYEDWKTAKEKELGRKLTSDEIKTSKSGGADENDLSPAEQRTFVSKTKSLQDRRSALIKDTADASIGGPEYQKMADAGNAQVAALDSQIESERQKILAGRPSKQTPAGPAPGAQPPKQGGQQKTTAPQYRVGDPVMYKGRPHKVTGINKDGTVKIAPQAS